MDELLKQMLGGEFDALKDKVQGLAGFDGEKASTFFSAIVEKVVGLFSSGQLDLAALNDEADVNRLVEKLDPSELGQKVGLSPDQAQAGLDEVMPHLVSKAKGLLGGGGLGDALGGLGGLGDFLK